MEKHQIIKIVILLLSPTVWVILSNGRHFWPARLFNWFSKVYGKTQLNLCLLLNIKLNDLNIKKNGLIKAYKFNRK